MKVFLSYSFNDNELYLITLLVDLFQKEGHSIETSDMFLGEPLRNYSYKVEHSDLFLGIISDSGNSKELVLKEYRYAKKCSISSVLLVEDSLEVSPTIKNYISFNRNNPEKAINELLGKTTSAKNKRTDDLESTVMAAGIIVGIAALISLMAGGSKK